MGFKQKCLCMGIGCLFIVFCMFFALACEKPSKSSSQETATTPNSKEVVTEKPPAPVRATSVKSRDLTFELVEGIEFADGTEVRSITKADIEALRDRPIHTGGNVADGVTLTNDKNEKVHVRTCKEYDAALEGGYSPYSGYDIAMASWFKYPCGTLNLLEIAMIPQQSFIPTHKEGIFDLELLPLSVFPVLSDYEQTYGYNIENVTYQNQVEKGLLKVIGRGQNWLRCEQDGLIQRLTEMARADFNDDGIEDILLSETTSVTQGSYRSYDMIILTRKSMEEKFEKVEAHDSK